ncbi:hypothetical protein F5B22DRAFT_657425 [Xylaria bambusicola]|uniref:uncharacterized protein n=1 Tax=Xylaria bambusicola TaxID=326684 RepID=UPI00200785B1|nr:uncharacterized protein F5B22DRAFT_657425 [Xylaria bambusicola]KAI0512964.1 hypothetical protein F5B22DRAFT_657425 [Xylaria bambusicola]
MGITPRTPNRTWKDKKPYSRPDTGSNASKTTKQPAKGSAARGSRAAKPALELGRNPNSEPATSSLIPAVLPTAPTPQTALQETPLLVSQQAPHRGLQAGPRAEPQVFRSRESLPTDSQYSLPIFDTSRHYQPPIPRYTQSYPTQGPASEQYGDHRDYLPSEQLQSLLQAGSPRSHSFTQHDQTEPESTLAQPIPMRPAQDFVDIQSLDTLCKVNDEIIWENQPLMPPVEHLGPDLKGFMWPTQNHNKNNMVDPGLITNGSVPVISGQVAGDIDNGAPGSSPSGTSLMPFFPDLVEQTPQASGSQNDSFPHDSYGDTSMESHGMNMNREPPAAPRYESNVIITSDGFNVFEPTLLTKLANECAKSAFENCPQAIAISHQLLMADRLFYGGIWAGSFIINGNVLVEYHRPAPALPDTSEHKRRDRRGAILSCKGFFDETGWCGDTGEVISIEFTDPSTGGQKERRCRVFAPVEEMETRPARVVHVFNLREYFYNRSLSSHVNTYAWLVAPDRVDYSMEAIYDNLTLLGAAQNIGLQPINQQPSPQRSIQPVEAPQHAAAENPAPVQVQDDEPKPQLRPDMPDEEQDLSDEEQDFSDEEQDLPSPATFAEWCQCWPLPEWPLGEITTCDDSSPSLDVPLLYQSLIFDMVDALVDRSSLATIYLTTNAADVCFDPECNCPAQFFSHTRSLFDAEKSIEPADSLSSSSSSRDGQAAQTDTHSGYLPEFDYWVTENPISHCQEEPADYELFEQLGLDLPEEWNDIDYDSMYQECNLDFDGDFLMPYE